MTAPRAARPLAAALAAVLLAGTVAAALGHAGRDGVSPTTEPDTAQPRGVRTPDVTPAPRRTRESGQPDRGTGRRAAQILLLLRGTLHVAG